MTLFPESNPKRIWSWFHRPDALVCLHVLSTFLTSYTYFTSRKTKTMEIKSRNSAFMQEGSKGKKGLDLDIIQPTFSTQTMGFIPWPFCNVESCKIIAGISEGNGNSRDGDIIRETVVSGRWWLGDLGAYWLGDKFANEERTVYSGTFLPWGHPGKNNSERI